MLTLALLMGPPLFASAVAMLVRPYRRFVGRTSVGCAGVSLAAAAWLAAGVVAGRGGQGPLTAVEPWGVDALSALVATCIAFVALLASALAPGGGDDDDYDPAQTRRYHIHVNAFVFTMLTAVTIQNIALMWVAIEATTITSAMAIPLNRTKASVEASWKYILVCSVGIALAFAGTVLGYFDFVTTAGHVPNALNWSVLRYAAPSLHPELLRLAFAFILVGYGTKAKASRRSSG